MKPSLLLLLSLLFHPFVFGNSSSKEYLAIKKIIYDEAIPLQDISSIPRLGYGYCFVPGPVMEKKVPTGFYIEVEKKTYSLFAPIFDSHYGDLPKDISSFTKEDLTQQALTHHPKPKNELHPISFSNHPNVPGHPRYMNVDNSHLGHGSQSKIFYRFVTDELFYIDSQTTEIYRKIKVTAIIGSQSSNHVIYCSYSTSSTKD